MAYGVYDTAEIQRMSVFAQLDPVFRQRLLALFAASGGRVGFGEGFRTPEQQAAGNAAKPGIVAPQGKSWHEVGVAADLVGDMEWLQQNAARFGLKTFADVNNEPWHVQPVEVPNGRPLNAPAPRLSQDYSGGSTVDTAGAPSISGNGPVDIPSDMKVIAVKGPDGVDRLYAIYQIADGTHISYEVPYDGSVVNLDGSKIEFLTQAESDAKYGRGIMAGVVTELAGVKTTFGSFNGMWNSVLGEVMGYNNPAKDDPEVLAVLAEFAARPDMSMAELQNKLKATQWFQQRTQDQLEWNDLSEAERAKRIQEAEARMIGTVFQFAGEDVDASDPRIANYIQDVASGKISYGAYTEIIKGLARENPESPWGRQVRDEGEAQRQRPIDIENTAQRIREQVERWGLQWSPQTIQQWAKDMVEKRKSDEDLNIEMRNQAQVLYPWKSPEMETATAAAPWLETYRRVMEDSGSLFTPEIQKALTAGTPVFDFETQLKKSEKWLGTKNGRDEMYSTITQMGQMMGFA